MFEVRPFRPGDLDALYRICLETGDNGRDATRLYRDPKLLGERYAAPYAIYAPELTFVLEDAAGVCGYVLGVADSAAFYAWLECEWKPPLRPRYPRPEGNPARWTPDERIARLFYTQETLPEQLEPYPAHLHVDLLPRAQGQGQGRRMLDAFLQALRERSVPGVHLGTGSRNERAVAFYRRYGFAELERRGDGVTFVMDL